MLLLLALILVLARGASIALEHLQRRELAQRLNIAVDSPYLDTQSFPENYFWETLKEGMTKKEVHEIVKGYELVLHCPRYAEIYYYYSDQTDKAVRFEILYDEDGKFTKLMGEGDSNTLDDYGCVPGLLGEP